MGPVRRRPSTLLCIFGSIFEDLATGCRLRGLRSDVGAQSPTAPTASVGLCRAAAAGAVAETACAPPPGGYERHGRIRVRKALAAILIFLCGSAARMPHPLQTCPCDRSLLTYWRLARTSPSPFAAVRDHLGGITG